MIISTCVRARVSDFNAAAPLGGITRAARKSYIRQSLTQFNQKDRESRGRCKIQQVARFSIEVSSSRLPRGRVQVVKADQVLSTRCKAFPGCRCSSCFAKGISTYRYSTVGVRAAPLLPDLACCALIALPASPRVFSVQN